MDEVESNDNREIMKELFLEGHKLTIYARNEYEFGWSLRVEDEKGMNSHWHEFFASAEEAINAALKAINEEGVKEFTECEEFNY